jgi:hypothetical protein
MHDIARLHRAGLQLLDHVGVAALRHEADVLAVLLLRYREAKLARDRPRLVLGQVAEREAQEVELLLGRGEQKVALVAVQVDRTEQRPPPRDRARSHIMAGGHCTRAELAGRLQQIGELDGLIAGHAGDRRLAARVAVGERLYHRFAETRLVIQHVMRNAQLGRDLPGIMDVLPRAACTRSVRCRAMIVELQSDANCVISGLA